MNSEEIKTELIELAEMLCRLAEIDNIPLRFGDIKSYGARAFLPTKSETGFIKVSTDHFTDNMYYREALVIHEVCHFIYYRWHKWNIVGERMNHHGPDFKRIEKEWLLEFGMVPLYSKAYWHTLVDTEGNVLWSNLD